MFRIFTFFLTYFVVLVSQAKPPKPTWIDYTKRVRQYSKDVYLSGFVSETIEKDKVSQSNDKLQNEAKLELLQSIKVNLKLESTLKLSNLNKDGQTKSIEDFVQNSYAEAQATIVGIQVETFYDKKAKVNYAFAYAKIAEVVKYYKQIYRTRLADIPPYFKSYEQNKSQDKIKALQDLDQIRKYMQTVQTAESILETLNKSTLGLAKTHTDNYARQLNSAFNTLLNRKDLDLNEVAYFLAYGLSLQPLDKLKGLYVNDLRYSETHLTSPFAANFAAALKNELLKFKFLLKDEDESSHYLQSVCTLEEEQVKFNLKVIDLDRKAVVAGNYNYLNKTWLESNKVEYIPKAVLKADLLKKLAFEHRFKTINGEGGWLKSQNLELKVSADMEAVSNLPVTLSRETDGIFSEATTDEKGRANFVLKSKLNKQAILASVNLSKFLNLPADHHFISTLTAPQYTFYLINKPIKIYVSSVEKNLEKPLPVNFLEPQIKQILSDEVYEFSESTESDLWIQIEANTRQGSSSYGISFSYIDATISVVSTASSNEIYKKKFSTIKGAGQTFELAGMKAFEALAKKMKHELRAQINK